MQITTGELAALLADAREAGRDEMPQTGTSRAAAARHAEQFRQQLGPRLRELRADIVAAGEPLLDWEGLEREKAARRRQTPETGTSCDCEALRARVADIEASRVSWRQQAQQLEAEEDRLRARVAELEHAAADPPRCSPLCPHLQQAQFAASSVESDNATMRLLVSELGAELEALGAVLKSERAHVARDVEALREDAALGKLVRAMPVGFLTHDGRTDDDSWSAEVGQGRYSMRTPEAALKEAGVTVAATDRARGAGE